MASGAHHLAGLAVSEPHLALHLAAGGPNQLGCRCRPSKKDQLQGVKASRRGGSRKKDLRCWKGKDQARRLITEAKWGSPRPPRGPLGFPLYSGPAIATAHSCSHYNIKNLPPSRPHFKIPCAKPCRRKPQILQWLKHDKNGAPKKPKLSTICSWLSHRGTGLPSSHLTK